MQAVINPLDIDIRLALGKSYGSNPIMIRCPMHQDKTASLAVYRSNLHCMGCGWHVSRRYASLAVLLGLWNGAGSENSEQVTTICRKLRSNLPDYINRWEGRGEAAVQPIDPYLPETFHQYLMCCEQDRLHDELLVKRGLTIETVKQYVLGYSITHWTIPVYDRAGQLITIRYRADESRTDKGEKGYRKYEGIKGRNETVLYPLPVVAGLSRVDELWVTEGEHDAIASNQAGSITLTAINGSSQAHRVPQMVADLGIAVGWWIIATDLDAAGEQAAGEIRTALLNRGQRVVRARWPFGKDLSAFYAGGGLRENIWYE